MITSFDASTLITLIEAREPFAGMLRRALTALADVHPGMPVARSRLAWPAGRVGPLKSGDALTLACHDTVFARPELVWVDLGRNVVELAAAVRARHGLRSPRRAACGLLPATGARAMLPTGSTTVTRVSGLRARVLA